MIPRQLYAKATELLEKYPIVALTGPRQSGKTTFSRQLRPAYAYVNLELDENKEFALEILTKESSNPLNCTFMTRV